MTRFSSNKRNTLCREHGTYSVAGLQLLFTDKPVVSLENPLHKIDVVVDTLLYVHTQ